MRRWHFAAFAALVGVTVLAGCVTQSTPPMYSYSYSYPYPYGYGYYSSAYPVTQVYPNGYTAAYSPDYNGANNTYDTAGGHGG